MVENSYQKLWHQEYSKQGIPSSFRDNPSESLVYFLEVLKKEGVTNGKALDIGSGKGRNSIFLAKQGFDVYSVDFVPEMIRNLKKKSEKLSLSDKIYASCSNVSEKWNLESNYFDIAIDTFCYTHQVTKSGKDMYRKELARVMKPGGYYLLTLAGLDDGYYGTFLKSSPDPKENMIIDPVNSIPMILYRKEDIETEFKNDFQLVNYSHKQHRNMMHGKEYQRSTHLFILEKK